MAHYGRCATLIILYSGLLLREGKGTTEETSKENNTMTWVDANNFCESKNTSLVDPFNFVNTSEGTFWTNRRMKNVNYVTYIAGCVNTSLLSQVNVQRRKIYYFWQCHNLCTHTGFFGIQNSTCLCLYANELLKNYSEQHLCMEENKDIIGKTAMRIQNGSTSDFTTIYGIFTGSVIDPVGHSCMTLSCNSEKDVLKSYDCSNENFQCVCSNGEKKPILDGNILTKWTDCFTRCSEDRVQHFSWISACDDINYPEGKNYLKQKPFWIAAIMQQKADNGDFCYRCQVNTFNCQYASCNETHFPECIKNEGLFSTDAITTIGLETSSSEVKGNFDDMFMTCFPNIPEGSVGHKSSTVLTTYTKTSDWIHILGCVNGEIESSRNFALPNPSVIFCEDKCKALEYFLVKGTLCLCTGLPTNSYISDVSACNILCKDSPHLEISCGGNNAFSLFKSSKVEGNFSHSCVALSCGTTVSQNDTKNQWFPENCTRIFPENHCIAVNGSVGSTMNGTWTNVRKGCVQQREYLPANITLTKEGIDDLCTRLNMSAQQWIGVVRLELTINFTEGGEIPDPSSVKSFQCTVCEKSECQLIKCNRTSSCDMQPLSSNIVRDSTLAFSSTTEDVVFHKKKEKSKNHTDLQISVPVGVSVVAIAMCVVVILIYRYRKRKGKPNNRFVQVHFQNEYADVVKSCTREENRRNEAAANASQDDPAYIDCKMDVYDHLGEKHLRHLEQSEYLYSHTGSSDSQYGDVSVAPSDDIYDHTKAFNTSNAEYDSCTRY